MASHNPRTGIVRWPNVFVQQSHDFWWTWGPKANRKKIVHSCGPRTVIARLPLAARTVPVKSQGKRTVILQQPHHGRAVALRWAQSFSSSGVSLAMFPFPFCFGAIMLYVASTIIISNFLFTVFARQIQTWM